MKKEKTPNKKLYFPQNYNGKLYTNSFTTIRNRCYVRVGETVDICLGTSKKNTLMGAATVLIIKRFKIKDLPAITSFLDTGYSSTVTKESFNRMWNVNEGSYLYIILLRYSKKNFELTSTPILL